jgi:hypothetical protein
MARLSCLLLSVTFCSWLLPLSWWSCKNMGINKNSLICITTSPAAAHNLARLRVATGCGAKTFFMSYKWVRPLAASSSQPPPSCFRLSVWHRWLHSRRLAQTHPFFHDHFIYKCSGLFYLLE